MSRDVVEVTVGAGKAVATVPVQTMPEISVYVAPLASVPLAKPTVRGVDGKGDQILLVDP